ARGAARRGVQVLGHSLILILLAVPLARSQVVTWTLQNVTPLNLIVCTGSSPQGGSITGSFTYDFSKGYTFWNITVQGVPQAQPAQCMNPGLQGQRFENIPNYTFTPQNSTVTSGSAFSVNYLIFESVSGQVVWRVALHFIDNLGPNGGPVPLC